MEVLPDLVFHIKDFSINLNVFYLGINFFESENRRPITSSKEVSRQDYTINAGVDPDKDVLKKIPVETDSIWKCLLTL